MSDSASVVVSGIVKSFSGVRALRGVDIEIAAGEVHGILGPNGSGKSTLMKIIAGLEVPDEGQVLIDGRALNAGSILASRKAGVVLMPQELTTVGHLTVERNIALGVEPSRFGITSGRRSRQLAKDALQRVGLDVSPDTYVEDLSATQRRMLMMASAVAGGARVLILDEPTAGLPVKESAQVLSTIARVAASGCTVLLVTHRLEQLRQLSNRITVLRDGLVTARFLEGIPERHELVRAIASDTVAAAASPVDEQALAGAGGDLGAPLLKFTDVGLDRLEHITLELRRGEMVGVAGLNGSGIEEFIEIASGERRPSQGSMLVGESGAKARTPHDAVRHGITFVSGNRKRMIMGDRTTATHVGLPSMPRRSPGGWVNQKREDKVARASLDVFGVTAQPGQSLETLSGGNQQRALMARSIASEASIIVAHEPTVGIDVHAREVLRGHLVRFSKTNAVLVVSADPDELVGLCSTVVCLRDGTVSEIIHNSEGVTASALLHAIT